MICRAAFAALLVAGCATAAAPPRAAPAGASTTLRLGQQARIGGLTVRALRLLEDSRCPRSVQCIQAGTVRLAIRLSAVGHARETVLRLGVAEPVGRGRFLWLAGVCPVPAVPGPITPSSYRFLLSSGANVAGAPADFPC